MFEKQLCLEGVGRVSAVTLSQIACRMHTLNLTATLPSKDGSSKGRAWAFLRAHWIIVGWTEVSKDRRGRVLCTSKSPRRRRRRLFRRSVQLTVFCSIAISFGRSGMLIGPEQGSLCVPPTTTDCDRRPVGPQQDDERDPIVTLDIYRIVLTGRLSCFVSQHILSSFTVCERKGVRIKLALKVWSWPSCRSEGRFSGAKPLRGLSLWRVDLWNLCQSRHDSPHSSPSDQF